MDSHQFKKFVCFFLILIIFCFPLVFSVDMGSNTCTSITVFLQHWYIFTRKETLVETLKLSYTKGIPFVKWFIQSCKGPLKGHGKGSYRAHEALKDHCDITKHCMMVCWRTIGRPKRLSLEPIWKPSEKSETLHIVLTFKKSLCWNGNGNV